MICEELKKITDSLGNITQNAYGGTGCSGCGGGGDNLVKITDANLKDTKFEYYKNGSRKNQTDALNHITSFTYDPPGFMASLTDPSDAATTFDKADLTMTKTDPLGKTTIYEYDKAGRIKNITDRNNKITHYTYTPDGVIDTITYDYPNGPSVSFTNDELDRITSMTDSLGTTTYNYTDYDSLNRILAVTDPNGFVVSYKYDAAWRLKELAYPGNKKVIYDYDALNRLWTVKLDWLNPVQTTTYHYDPAGRLDYTDNFNGTITDYGYDDANRLTSLINKKSDDTIIASYVFPAQPEGLDAVGNIKKVIQTEPLTPAFTEETTGYTYNLKKNRLDLAGSDSFTYDNEGQLATGYGSTYTFDYEHRLTASTGAFNATYSYDGVGNRLQAVRGSVTTKYIYDINGNLLAEADGSNNITKYYVHGLGLLAMVVPSTPDNVYTYHFNNIGSTIAITDATQEIKNKYSYDPFGVLLSEVEDVNLKQPFKYVGQYGVMTEPNGFYYMKARYYDPKVGRFVSEDPIGFGGGDVNLMRYVRNRPTMLIDPFGLWFTAGHDAIIDSFVKKYHPNLAPQYILAMKAGSKYVDTFQDPKDSYMHHMRDGRSNQSIIEAEKAMKAFINRHLDKYKCSLARGDLNNAYKELGMALHPVMDSTAPPHENFQMWRGMIPLLFSGPHGASELIGTIDNDARFDTAVERMIEVLNGR